MPETTLETYMRIPSLSHPTPSTTGDLVALIQTTGDDAKLHICDLEQANGTRELASDVVEVPPRWAPKGDQLFYVTRTRDTRTIRVTSLQGSSTRLVSHEDQCILQDVSSDGKFLYYIAGDAIWRYDLDEQTAERLINEGELIPGPEYSLSSDVLFCSPDGTQVAYTRAVEGGSAGFHPVGQVRVARANGVDARTLNIGTDSVNASSDELVVRGWHPDSECLLLGTHPFAGRCGVYDLQRGQGEWFGTHLDASDYPFPGREAPLTFLPDGSGFLAWRLKGTDKRLVVYDLEGEVQLFDPGGLIHRGMNSRPQFLDTNRVAFVRESETEPGALISIDVTTGETNSLSEVEYGQVPVKQITAPEHVRYTTADGTTAPGLLYQSSEQPSPTIVEVYSGYQETSGWLPNFSREVQYLLAEGYTVFRPVNPADPYTGASHAHNAAAGEWVQQRDDVDENRVAVYGFSLGGYDALMQAFRFPELWTACVSVDGAPDLLLKDEQQGGVPEMRMSLGNPGENESAWREQNPVDELKHSNEGICPPLLFMQTSYGSDKESERLRDAMHDRGWEQGDEFQYLRLEGQSHVPKTPLDQVNRWEPIIAFLSDHLLLKG